MSFIANLTDFRILFPNSSSSPDKGTTRPILTLSYANELKQKIIKNISIK